MGVKRPAVLLCTSLGLCARCVSVLRLTDGLLRVGVGGSIRSLCRTTVASLKFTRTAGNRRPFIDCSSSRSEAFSPSFSLFLSLSPSDRDRMIRAGRSAG